MSTRLADSLVAAETDMSRIHRRVVRVGAAAAWFAAALFIVAGLLAGDEDLFTEAMGAVLAASLMTALILLRRENAGVAMIGAAIVVMVWHSVIGNEDTTIPAAVAMVVISAIGMLFIGQSRRFAIASVSLILFLAPQLWKLSFGDALTLGTVIAVCFILTSVIFSTVRGAAAALNQRFQMLFEHSPTAVLEEDWSEALAYVRSEYTGRPERIRAFLLAYPAVVRRAVNRARILRVNAAAVALLEAGGPDELLGNRDATRMEPDTLEAFVDALVALYEGKSFYEQEVPAMTRKGRRIWLQARSVDSSSEHPATTILVGLADITHMKARQEAMAELVRSKDEFIAKVSHELRTPLTGVLGLTREMAGGRGLSTNEQTELMHLVAGQAEEMAYIVDDLLVAARAESGSIAVESVDVDMGAALRSTLRGLAMRVDDIPEAIPDAVGDPNRVRQILRNLLTNAQRYGGPNTRVVAGATFDNVWVEVRDDGDGVPEADAEHIFDPYGVAHAGVQGSVGLGLSVARQLAEIMKGSLTYRRDRGETIFRLDLPIAGLPDAALNKSEASL